MNDLQPEGHLASHIERRKFLATLGVAAAACLRLNKSVTLRRIEPLHGAARHFDLPSDDLG